MEKLTRRQKDTYDFIIKFALKNNVLPSVREVAQGLGIKSIASVHFHFQGLIKAGYIIPYGEKSFRYSVKGLKYEKIEDTEDKH